MLLKVKKLETGGKAGSFLEIEGSEQLRPPGSNLDFDLGFLKKIPFVKSGAKVSASGWETKPGSGFLKKYKVSEIYGSCF